MTTDLSLIHLIAEASIVVQLVMLILVLASVFSWALIYAKVRQFRDSRRRSGDFEARFWSGGSVAELYREVQNRDATPDGSERLFAAGFGEYARLQKQGHEPKHVLDGAQRSMRIAMSRETDRLEGNLAFLATVGSVSPYVGLFGTVWGIKYAFEEIAIQQSTNLAVVAPGIAEALLATAMGLFAAIPAVIFYNKLSNDADKLAARYESFADEFSVILSRQLEIVEG